MNILVCFWIGTFKEISEKYTNLHDSSQCVSETFEEKWYPMKKPIQFSSQLSSTSRQLQYKAQMLYEYFPFCHIKYEKDVYWRVKIC